MRAIHRLYVLPLLLMMLTACATLGLEQPKTFNERLAAAYTTVTAARDSAGTLLSSGKITAADAQQVQNQCDNVRSGLDIARDIHAKDPPAGDAKLTAVLAGLTALQAYLQTRGT